MGMVCPGHSRVICMKRSIEWNTKWMGVDGGWVEMGGWMDTRGEYNREEEKEREKIEIIIA